MASFSVLMMEDEYLWVEITKRFHIRELCRFRCVCKSWNSRISSSSFITRHHLVTSSSHSHKPYFLSNDSETKGAFSYALYDPRLSLADHYPTFLPSPFQRRNVPYHLVDVVHGVVCLSRPDSTLLWNPAINKYVEIPPLPSCRKRLDGLGFGFNISKNYDYSFKVVTIRCHRDLIEVFSTLIGSWKRVSLGHVEIDKFVTTTGCFLKGVIYWIVLSYHNEKLLLMFDCESEELKTIKLPFMFNRPGIDRVRLFVYCGMMSVFAEARLLEQELWAMEENFVARIWRKLSLSDPVDDFVEIEEDQVYQYQDGIQRLSISKDSVERLDELWVKQPLNGYVFEESMFLMDDESQATSFTAELDEDGNICYVRKDGPIQDDA